MKIKILYDGAAAEHKKADVDMTSPILPEVPSEDGEYKLGVDDGELVWVKSVIPTPLPVKGQVITMNIDGENKSYRVLSINGNIAEVVAMFTVGDPIAFDEDPSDGYYSDSTLNTYLNGTWYDDSVTAEAKLAIVPKQITQHGYVYSEDVYNAETHASYADYSTMTVHETGISRNIYALDIDDIETYFNHVFSKNDISTLLNAGTGDGDYAWLRSLISTEEVEHVSSAYICSVAGAEEISGEYQAETQSVRPAFTIDLSKISWS